MRRKVMALAAAAVLPCSVAQGHEFEYLSRALGRQVVPPTNSGAVATAYLTYNHHILRGDWTMEVYGITLDDLAPKGPNGTSAHVRVGRPWENGPIVVDLHYLMPFEQKWKPIGTDPQGNEILVPYLTMHGEAVLFGGKQGKVESDPVLVHDYLIEGRLYMEIYTKDYINGEIRGQIWTPISLDAIRPIPAPGVATGLLAPLAALAWRRRR